MPDMNHARSDFGCTVLNGKIYVSGGGSKSRHVEVFDPCKEEWSFVASTNRIMDKNVRLVANYGKIIAIGDKGRHSTRTVTEIYDPESNLWVDGPSKPLSRRMPALSIGMIPFPCNSRHN